MSRGWHLIDEWMDEGMTNCEGREVKGWAVKERERGRGGVSKYETSGCCQQLRNQVVDDGRRGTER